jgi:pimeloyl-ACP methyl ester carboxylesterase
MRDMHLEPIRKYHFPPFMKGGLFKGRCIVMTVPILRGFANTPEGQIHYAVAGKGKPVLLLHQTPRSWDEYRDILPILGEKHWAIAMDTIGFGDSYRPTADVSIEIYARGVIRFLDAMGIGPTSIVGHHTGGVIAVEVAASYPERVEKLILSSTPYVDAADREKRKTRPPIDEVEPKADGSHLTELWQRRMPFYPKDRPDLLRRFVLDALKVWDRMEEGHRAVNKYRMENKVSLIKAPTLVLAGTEDPFSYPRMKPLSEAIKGCRTAEIKGGMVPMVDQLPVEFARIVLEFLG